MKRNVIFFIITGALLAVFGLLPVKTYLVLEPLKDKGEKIIAPLNMSSKFSILYTHSIHLSDVLETYKPADNLWIQQTTLTYEDTAIGMPGGASGNEKFGRTPDGKYVISNMERKFPYIDIQIGQVAADHRLIIKKKEYRLDHFFEKGSFVRMSIKKLTLLEIWRGVSLDG